MDLIELLMELENEFELQLPDEVVTELSTVGKTAACVIAVLQRQPASSGICQTARSFYRLRNALCDRLNTPRQRVRPNTRIGDLVPPRMRRHWPKIADVAGLRREHNIIFKSPAPPLDMSVRLLIETRCKRGYRRFDGSIDRAAVFERVRLIVSNQLGVPISEIHAESRYIEDLGAS